jgi:hypothetical protein
VQQLLWLETLIKLSSGLLLALAPLTTLRILGLPRPDIGFWPRIVGILLLGLAAALFLEGTSGGHGLGLAGVVIIDLAGVAMLATLLVLERGPSSSRGRAVVWAVICALVTLSVLEIAVL